MSWQKAIATVSTESFIRILNGFELGLFALIAYARVVLIWSIMSLEPELREVICFMAYETGWTFIVLFLLSLSNLSLLAGEPKPGHWITKVCGLLSLLLLVEHIFWQYWLPLLVLSIYYIITPVSLQFRLTSLFKWLYLGLALVVAVVISFINFEYRLLIY